MNKLAAVLPLYDPERRQAGYLADQAVRAYSFRRGVCRPSESSTPSRSKAYPGLAPQDSYQDSDV